MNWFLNKILFIWFESIIYGTGKGTWNSQYGICSRWYGYWFIVNYMTCLIGLDGSAQVWVICVRCVNCWGVCIVCVMSVNRWVTHKAL